MIDLDDEIVEMIVALEPVATVIPIQSHRLIVMAALWIFAPGVFGANGANRQERMRPRMAVGAPPQLPWPEGAFRGSAVAFALVGPDAAAPERHRDRSPTGRQPAAAGVAGGGADSDRGKRSITQCCLIST